MNFWVWVFIFFCWLAVMGVLQQRWALRPGRILSQKFAALGRLAGLSKTEIVWQVGDPNSFSALGDGKTLLQWQQPGYHIALLFDGDICLGVSHESSFLNYE